MVFFHHFINVYYIVQDPFCVKSCLAYLAALKILLHLAFERLIILCLGVTFCVYLSWEFG